MGLLKAVTALKWCSVPPNLHLKQPNTKIEIKAMGTKVLLQSEVQSLLVKSVPLSSGVSAFGMSGTNSHAVLASGAVPLPCISLKSAVSYQLRAFDWWGEKGHSLAPAQSVSDTGFVDTIQSIMPQTCSSDLEIALQVFLLMLVEQQVGQMVTLHDPLMQVGLTSTKAIKLVTLLQAQLGLEGQVDVLAIFNHPTVCQLAAHIFEFADLESNPWSHPIVSNPEQFKKSLTDSKFPETSPLAFEHPTASSVERMSANGNAVNSAYSRDTRLSNAGSTPTDAHTQDNGHAYESTATLAQNLSLSLLQTQVITAQPSEFDSVVVPICSITKTVTAIGILQLVDQGMLSLTQPIHEVLPWFRPGSVIGPPMTAVTNPITISHLLLHQSGIGYAGSTSFRSDLVDGLYELSSLSPQGMREIMARHNGMRPLEAVTRQIAMMPLKFEPGTSFEYSMGHVVLGAAIEEVCQQALSDALQDLVFSPLGIHSAQFFELQDVDVELKPSGRTWHQCDTRTNLELGDSNMTMAVRDLHTLISAVNIFDMNSQKLFSTGLLQIASEAQFDCTEINEIAVTPLGVIDGPSMNWSLLGPLRNGRLATSGAFGVVTTIGKDGALRLAIRDQLVLFWDLVETFDELFFGVSSLCGQQESRPIANGQDVDVANGSSQYDQQTSLESRIVSLEVQLFGVGQAGELSERMANLAYALQDPTELSQLL